MGEYRVDGSAYKRRTGVTQGLREEDDVNPVTSENIKRVRAIGGHVAGPLTVFTIKFPSTRPVRLLASATVVFL